MNKKHIYKQAKDVTHGLIHSATDTVLFSTSLLVSFINKKYSKISSKIIISHLIQLLPYFSNDIVTTAFYNVRRKRFVAYKWAGEKQALEITQKGQKRLKRILPSYKSTRPWNGQIFFINYMFSSKNKKYRMQLLETLQNTHIKMLNKNAWICLKNPSKTISYYSNTYPVFTYVFVSKIDTLSMPDRSFVFHTLHTIYDLKMLNNAYKQFIHTFKLKQGINPSVHAHYLSILQKDPQLPFEVLPDWWLGDKAYKLLQTYSSANSIST